MKPDSDPQPITTDDLAKVELRPATADRIVYSRRYTSLANHYDLLFAHGKYAKAWEVLLQMAECARILGMSDGEIVAILRRDGLGVMLGHLTAIKRKGREPATTRRS